MNHDKLLDGLIGTILAEIAGGVGFCCAPRVIE